MHEEFANFDSKNRILLNEIFYWGYEPFFSFQYGMDMKWIRMYVDKYIPLLNPVDTSHNVPGHQL